MSWFYFQRDLHHSSRGKNGPFAMDYESRRIAEEQAIADERERVSNRLAAERLAKVNRMRKAGDLTEYEAETLRDAVYAAGFDRLIAPYARRARKKREGDR